MATGYNKQNATQFISELTDHAADVLIKYGLSDSDSVNLAFEISKRACQNFKGTQLYIGKDAGLEVSERDKKLFADFDGYNHNYLATKYNICLQRVYQIIASVRNTHIAQNQLDLFPDD